MPICQLPQSVINKIAAGEVIERAASVVKELMENSIDAGSTRIDVSVEGGGSELVRVCDNGSGMAAGELPLAVASHATSKIRDADDLFRVGTLGFRGEALASIAEVSRFILRSRMADSDAGAELEVVAGQTGPVTPCGCPTGTTIEVRQLFFNTPVRRKFLKTAQTEMGHVSEAFTRLALAHPKVHFTLRHNQRTIYDLPPVEQTSQRIGCFFGQDLAAGLIAVESRDDAVGLRGFVAHPSHSRSHPRMQYLFLNGRHIRDRALQHALGEAYRGLLLTGRYPICFLWLSLPPEMVDVNVHPTKMEVRFQDGGRIYSQLLGTLRTRFLTTDLSTRIQPMAESEPASAHDATRTAQIRQELTDWAKGQMAQWNEPAMESAADAPLRQTGLALAEPPARSPLVLNELDETWLTRRPAARPLAAAPADAISTTEAPEAFAIESRPITDGHEAYPAAGAGPRLAQASALQVHNRYLIAETTDGLEVIDQHALHERILYELLREKVLSGALESQHLLVPEPVDLCADEVAAVLGERELLARLGMTVEAFGGETVIVRSYPAMLSNFKPVEILRGLVERLLAGGKKPDRRDLLDELLHMISCKAAIKAGDRLSIEEIDALLRQRHLVRDTHHCPHGRPTALVFTREELDRQFKRT